VLDPGRRRPGHTRRTPALSGRVRPSQAQPAVLHSLDWLRPRLSLLGDVAAPISFLNLDLLNIVNFEIVNVMNLRILNLVIVNIVYFVNSEFSKFW
jgi:hypothetical protein